MRMPGAHPAIELQGLTKTFGSIVANKDIDLTVYNGEILALLGENGSGKTTLMNMLSGIYRPDAGHIRVNGKEVHIRSPHDAIALGIGMIHQHFKLVDVLSVQDNIVLGTTGHYANRKQLAREIRDLCDRFGLHIDPARKIYSLSVSEKQTVEILKVLYRGARTLVLDEPTAVLTPQEIDRLFAILRKMRDEGCAIIIITHKLNEVLEISDRVTILRKGHCIGTVNTKETTARELTERMVGAAVDLSIHRPEPLRDAPMLDVHHLTVVNGDGVRALDDVNFSIAAGEILGVAGVAGSGQKELCEAIAGLQPIAGGAILCQHVSLEGLSPREIIRRGVSMSFIPEDRLGMGLVPSMGMVDNMLLKEYQNQPGALVDRAPARDLANRLVKQLNICLLYTSLGAYQQGHRCDACAGLGYTDACLNCAGTGFAFGSACLACGGSGRYACRTCGGYGVMTNDYTRECPFCEGTGVAGTCSTCGGGGYGMLSGTLMMCTDCLGSGEAVCPWCSAAGIKMGYLRNS